MNIKKELFTVFLISFVSLLCFITIALLVSKHTIINFDRIIIDYVQGLESPWLTNIMKAFTFIGGTIPVAVISLLAIIILFKVFKHPSELVLFITVILGANVLFSVLKQLFHRERPDLHRLTEAGNYSFPSGHATMALALYGVLTFLLWRHTSTLFGRTVLIIFSIFMIGLIGISRIYLGVHYPSDIIAGYFIGTFWLTLAIGSYQKYKVRKYQ